MSRAAAEAKAALAVVDAQYQDAERTFIEIAERLAYAKAQSEKANGLVVLARLRAKLEA